MTDYKQVKTLNSNDAAYIAGLIDGEGTITLSRRHRNENRQLVVSISNNEKGLLDYVLDVTGTGSISKKRTYSERHSVNFSYKISNRQALDLLRQIVHLMKSYKKNRAEIILDRYLKLTPRNGKYTEQLKLERENFINEFFKIVPHGADS